MKDFFTVGEAAQIAGMTAETLRHYDRISLVKPGKIDGRTGYRYYSGREIVRLKTVKLLAVMDLPLDEIKKILSYNDFEKIIAMLRKADRNARQKIEEIRRARAQIRRARVYYESKLGEKHPAETPCAMVFPARTILLSDSLEKPDLDNLWQYHRHFYAQLPQELHEQFAFEDLAGVYTQDGSKQQMFAVCTKYKQTRGIRVLPAGKYLCAECGENECAQMTANLMALAKRKYHTTPQFSLKFIVISGILQWKYQIQVFVGNIVKLAEYNGKEWVRL